MDAAPEENKTSLPEESPAAEEKEEDVEQVESDHGSVEGDFKEQDNSEELSEAQTKPDQVEKKISETFFYNYEDIYSRPFVTENSGIPVNLLTLKHSFGYDCTRRANLLMMDSQTLLYIAGNYVVLLDLKTKSHCYVRSSGGGGIGFILAHPTKQYFAVGEKGRKPNLIIYDYPSLRPYRILRDGTEEAYVFGDFKHDGTLLASVGSSPDYMLTIWDWKQEMIVLRSKAFSQDVYKVTFSADNEEQLTTSGVGHIRFWKMALTFTGLKLQGALGRFGKTAVSDIIGYVELPDGKVISGTEWGNLLLWEGALIKVELCRGERKPCHSGPVSQLILEKGELLTVGKDGFIRLWNFETIDAADSVDDTGLLEVEPMKELHVGKNVSLSFMSKIHDSGQAFWYAQDTNGAIWKLDLSFSNMTQDPECLFTFHSGRIEAMSVSPITYLLATTALDGSVRIYDFISDRQLSEMKFKQGGTALTWAPRVVNPKGSLMTVGFEDGIFRIIEVYDPKGLPVIAGIGTAELNLRKALKPHAAAVTALAYERNGAVLATGSKDKTVFFFAVEDEYEPIGFICVPGPVQALQWSPPSHAQSTLLILCENGFVLQVPAPVPGEHNTASTYQLKNLPMQYFHFHSIKSRIKLEEEIALREKKREEKEKAKLEWIRQQQEMGNKIEEEAEEEPKEEPLPPIYIPEEPSPILCGFYSAPGKFWLSLGGYDSGFLYHCEFSHDDQEDPEDRKDEPFEVIPMEDTDNNPIHQIFFCTSRVWMFCGMQNGSLRAYSLQEKDLSADTLKEYWSFSVHDNDYGQIRGICSSYDDRFLITCGGDGNIFTFNILSPEDVQKELKAKIPSPRSALEKEKAAEDIEDSNTYNIEEVKQKQEHDRKMKEVEEKKQKKREKLIALRHEFLLLLQKNQKLPKHMQLHREQFEMDRKIFEELDRQTAQRIQLVQNELAWEHEKHSIGLQKLRKQFRDSLEFDTVVVHAIQSNHQISTYRLLVMSHKYYEGKERPSWERTVLKQAWKQPEKKQISIESKRTRISEGEEEIVELTEVQKPTTRYIESRREKVRRSVEKSDKVKAKILKRKAEWEELYKSKPSDDYESPKDVEEIKAAQENIGCYKLKSAPNYRVPEQELMNIEKKVTQLTSLEVLIHKRKVNMNKEIMSLRDLKVSVIEEIKCFVKELKCIQAALDLPERLPLPLIPQLHPDEVPEKKFEYNTDILLKFKEDQEAKPKPQGQLEGSPSYHSFRQGFLRAPSIKEADSMTQAAGAHQMKTASSVVTEQQRVSETEKAEPTEIELEILKREKIKNLYLQETLIKKINALVINFDAELRFLRHKKLKLDVQMKNAELRYVTWYQELLILKNFEKHENLRRERITTLIGEQEAMQPKLNDCIAQIEDRKCEIIRLQECEKALYANFQASLGENNEFADFLTKVLMKKVKCVEKREREAGEEHVNEEQDEEDENEENDGESSLGTDENSVSEDEAFDDSVCPENCSEALFQNTIQLWQKRLEIEEALAKEKKVAANLRKKYNALAKKAKELETSLDTADRELDTFQREKQQRMNDLYVTVPLKLHQVEYLINGEMPHDFSQALVFTNQSLEYLQRRIVDLHKEKLMQRQIYKEAQEQHEQLIQDKKEMEITIRQLEEKCNYLMMKKFGRLVDFEAVQSYSANIRVEELEVQIMEKEYEHSQELKEWEKRISHLQQQLMKLTKENSSKLQQLNQFCFEKHQLETKLAALKNDTGIEFQHTRTTDIKEKARLESRLKRIAGDTALLRQEISLLNRKGGY